MKTVKFIISNVEEYIEKDKIVEEAESLRKVIISINNEYVNNTPIEVRKKYFTILQENHPLDISVNKEFNGIYFFINKEEQVVFLTLYEHLERDTTISELENLISKGYLNGTTDTVYVKLPQGLGSGQTPDYLSIILTSVSKLVIPVVGGIFTKKIKQFLFMRKMKKIAKHWIEYQGVRGAKQIRIFIDNNGEWRTEELKKCLDIDEEVATNLLISLGYELEGNTWHKSYSDKAINNRKRWEEYSEHNYIY